MYAVQLPLWVNSNVDPDDFVTVHVIEGSLPLLLSKRYLREAGATEDHASNQMTLFGKVVQLAELPTGHSVLPLWPQ